MTAMDEDWKASDCWEDVAGEVVWKAGSDMTPAEVAAAVMHQRVCNQGGCPRMYLDGVHWSDGFDVPGALATELTSMLERIVTAHAVYVARRTHCVGKSCLEECKDCRLDRSAVFALDALLNPTPHDEQPEMEI